MIRDLIFATTVIMDSAVAKQIFQEAVATGKYYGIDASVSSNGTVITTASWEDNGKVYVYRYENGIYTKTVLIPTGLTAGARFGQSLDVSEDGNTIVIGALYQDYSSKTDSGCAYVFKYANGTWTFATIVSSDLAAWDNFGMQVSLSSNGNRVAVASHVKTVSGKVGAGKVYLFDFNGTSWSQTLAIPNPVPASYNYFGGGLALSNDGTVLVMAANGSSSYSPQGFVLIYKLINGTWSSFARIDGPTAYEAYGSGVNISPDNKHIIIGSSQAMVNGLYRVGKAYLYNIESTPVLIKTLYPKTIEENAQYGQSVTVSNDYAKIAISAPGSALNGVINVGKVELIKGSNVIEYRPEAPILNCTYGYSITTNSDHTEMIVTSIGEVTPVGVGKIYSYSI